MFRFDGEVSFDTCLHVLILIVCKDYGFQVPYKHCGDRFVGYGVSVSFQEIIVYSVYIVL